MNSSKHRKPEEYTKTVTSLHRALINLNEAKTYAELQESINEVVTEELDFKDSALWLKKGEDLQKISSEPKTNHKIEEQVQKSFEKDTVVAKGSENTDICLPLENYGVLALKEGSKDNENLLNMVKDTVLFTVKSLKQENRGLNGTELHLKSKNSELFPATIAEITESKCSIDDVLPNSNGGEIYYLKIDDMRSKKLRRELENLNKIKKCKVLESRGSNTGLKVKTENKTFFSSLMNLKASIEKIEARPEKLKVIIWSSSDIDTVDIFEEFRKAKGDWEVIKKKNRKRKRKPEGQSEKIEEILTEKQLEALKQAYRSGYYKYPRECSAKEVASSLEITDSTLFQHLQAAQKKIIEHCLEFPSQQY